MPAPARQLCAASNRQLMTDAADTVECPACLRSFKDFPTQRNRGQLHPIVPSHLADGAGLAKVELAKLKRGSSTPRPF